MRAPPVTGALDGLVAFPVPQGDPSGLWRLSARLRGVAGPVARSGIGGGVLPPQVVQDWSGAAADEARSEAALLGGRVAALADRCWRAAAVVGDYGDALDVAQRTTVGLQAHYDAVRVITVLSGPADEATALIAARYAAAAADLEQAGATAAHRLHALASEVGDGPVGRGGRPSATGWGEMWADPDPRAVMLAGLPLVAAARHRIEAEAAADDIVAWLGDAADAMDAGDDGPGHDLRTTGALAALDGAQRALDPWSVDAVATLLDRWGRDPVFAAALWARLSPNRVAATLGGLALPPPAGPHPVRAEWRASRVSALLQGLGAALALAVNPVYARGLDPLDRARLDRGRQPLLVRLARSTSDVTARSDGSTIGGAWAQGRLLDGMSAAGLSPGVAYAESVGVALVAAEAAGHSGRGPSATTLTGPHGESGTLAIGSPDAIVALTHALSTDIVAARAWLLHPLPGTPGRMVVDHLVDSRYLVVEASVAAAGMSALGGLVAASEAGAGADGTGAFAATELTAAYLGAVGRTSLTSPAAPVFRRALAPGLGELAQLLGAHPDALTATLDGSAAPGVDAAGLLAEQRLVRQGRDPGTWEVVIADRATAAALIGELALEDQPSVPSVDPTASTASPISTASTASPPALARLWSGLAPRLEADLVAAIEIEAHHHPSAVPTGSAVEAQARRLGAMAGFVLASAGGARVDRAATVDAQHRALAQVADQGLGRLTIPGAAGRLATPLVRAAATQVVDRMWPTDGAQAERAAAAVTIQRQRDDALVSVRTLVSRAGPWAADQAPAVWAGRVAGSRGPTAFWDSSGVPLAEDVMTTAQRRSFTDWRRDVGLPLYDTLPEAVRAAVDAGVAEVTDAMTGRGSPAPRPSA